MTTAVRSIVTGYGHMALMIDNSMSLAVRHNQSLAYQPDAHHQKINQTRHQITPVFNMLEGHCVAQICQVTI